MVAAVLVVIRTCLEERMLQAELSGHREYAQDIRHHLLPNGW
jgi:protein-S-isoprenylcysteine O-methyltransferase Ste14